MLILTPLGELVAFFYYDGVSLIKYSKAKNIGCPEVYTQTKCLTLAEERNSWFCPNGIKIVLEIK